MANPNYVAKKSAWSAVTLFRVLLFWLIIPLIIMIVDIIIKKHEIIEFYDDYVVKKSGVLSKKEKRVALIGVVGVSISQTIWGRICNYGDVYIDVVGKWDVNTSQLANPNGLKNYLEPFITKASKLQGIVAE